jgi:hypothetical protein
VCRGRARSFASGSGGNGAMVAEYWIFRCTV